METIEFRLNKKRLIPMLLLLTAGAIAGAWHVYVSGKDRYSTIIKVIYAATAIACLYTMYFQARMIWNKTAVLTFTPSDIIINKKGKTESFLWLQVINWEIEEDGNNHYLTIQTAETKKKISISWLDRKPAEIELLLHQYKRL